MTAAASPAPVHVLIVEARFYEDLADELVRGAVTELERAGATYERITVPGSAIVLARFAAGHGGPRAMQTGGRTRCTTVANRSVTCFMVVF